MRHGVPLQTTTLAGIAAIFVSLVLVLLLPPTVAVAAWIAFAFLAPSSMLAYPLLTAAYPTSLSGRVNTALNFVVFVAAFLGQWGYGVLLGAVTPALGVAGAHALGIGTFAALLAVSLAWAVFDARRP
jgi:hypothetical protein